MRFVNILALFATASLVLGAPVRRHRGGPGGPGNGTSPTFTFTLSDGTVKTETLQPLSSGAPRPTAPPAWTYTLSSGVVETVSPQRPGGGSRGVVPVTLSDGSVVTVTLPSPTGAKPTGTETPVAPVVTVTNSAGALETITLTRPARPDGQGGREGGRGGSRGVVPVTLSDGSVVTVTLPSPTGAKPTGTETPVAPVVTVTNSAGALETVTLTRPARPDGQEGGSEGGRGGSRGVVPVTLSDGSVVTVTLPSPTGAKPTGTETPVAPVVTVTNSAGALETITLTRPARPDGQEGGREGGRGGSKGQGRPTNGSAVPTPTNV